jgi:single-strand DNA-binding protein
MSKGVNKVILVGNLGRDPEIRYSQSGMAICKMSLGISARTKRGDNWVDTTDWVRLVAFGKTAEHAGKYLQRGSQIYVEGKIRTSRYEDKDGITRFSTEVIVDAINFLSKTKSQKEEEQEDLPPYLQYEGDEEV